MRNPLPKTSSQTLKYEWIPWKTMTRSFILAHLLDVSRSIAFPSQMHERWLELTLQTRSTTDRRVLSLHIYLCCRLPGGDVEKWPIQRMIVMNEMDGWLHTEELLFILITFSFINILTDRLLIIMCVFSVFSLSPYTVIIKMMKRERLCPWEKMALLYSGHRERFCLEKQRFILHFVDIKDR